jgi:periplasmic protein TonB
MAQNDTTIYKIVEQQPEYPEGMGALFKYLGQNIKYPTICRENGIEGTLYIRFIIEKDGSVKDITCTFGCQCNGYVDSVSDALKNMPKWKAGKQNGKPVRVQYTLPLKIHLE